jgi:hypothetical protein
MWAKIQAQQVRQHNVVEMMKIDMLALGVLQTQMETLTNQATIIIGFTVVMLGGETLLPLVSIQSEVCVYKSWYSMLFAILFFFFHCICMSSCVILVVMVAYVKQATQGAALVVSTGAAVAQTRVHVAELTYLFVVAIWAFMLTATFLVILFVGMPNRIEREDRLVYDDHGMYYLACINRHDPADIAMSTAFGAALAALNSSILLLMAAFLVLKMRAVHRSYQAEVLMEWYARQQAEEQAETEAVQQMLKQWTPPSSPRRAPAEGGPPELAPPDSATLLPPGFAHTHTRYAGCPPSRLSLTKQTLELRERQEAEEAAEARPAGAAAAAEGGAAEGTPMVPPPSPIETDDDSTSVRSARSARSARSGRSELKLAARSSSLEAQKPAAKKKKKKKRRGPVRANLKPRDMGAAVAHSFEDSLSRNLRAPQGRSLSLLWPPPWYIP